MRTTVGKEVYEISRQALADPVNFCAGCGLRAVPESALFDNLPNTPNGYRRHNFEGCRVWEVEGEVPQAREVRVRA